MHLLNALILGIVQGVTEFLPISSSGHLSIAQNLFGLASESDVLFDTLLHLGTLVAVFAAYWEDIREMILEFFDLIRDLIHGTVPSSVPPARRLILLVIVGTLPLFVILPFRHKIEELYNNTYFIGAALLVTGALLFACDRIRKGRKTEKSATMLDVLVVGAGQAIATCPGISRSGMTISAGCFRGFDRRFAVRFGFLLSIPAVIGANILQIGDVIEAGGIDVKLIPAYLLGVAAAMISGYLSIRLVRLVADKGKFGLFSYYCWFVGAATIVLSILKGMELLPWLKTVV
ncbi:MAG: undecaprenyl-diphosphate phosphatase [Oscillospiraceae bacterium]|nr:undecaprenyl-diphosphate phosphatase [Oscillospiraceae bacterium]